jgi:hypothetical protein
MSTDSILEEKIMLNLLDMHKKAKLLISAPGTAERDIEALERSLIKRDPSPINKTPRGKPPGISNFSSNNGPSNIPLSTKHSGGLQLPPQLCFPMLSPNNRPYMTPQQPPLKSQTTLMALANDGGHPVMRFDDHQDDQEVLISSRLDSE